LSNCNLTYWLDLSYIHLAYFIRGVGGEREFDFIFVVIVIMEIKLGLYDFQGIFIVNDWEHNCIFGSEAYTLVHIKSEVNLVCSWTAV
jgi:hypothetical protein